MDMEQDAVFKVTSKQQPEKVHRFEESKVLGDQAEKIFEEALKNLGITYKRPIYGGKHDVDFLIQFDDVPLWLKVDVKNDDVARRTKNLAFEIQSSPGVPGWFIEPKAHAYVIFVGEDAFVFSEKDFLMIANSNVLGILKNIKPVRNDGYLTIIATMPINKLKGRYKANNLEHAIKQLEGIARNILKEQK